MTEIKLKGGERKMKKKTMVSLIAIVAITVAVVFAGCIESPESTTKIREIWGQPDEYDGKKVTVVGSAWEVHSGDFSLVPWGRGFKVSGKTGRIHVDCEDYDDKLPVSGNEVKVIGIVRLGEVGGSQTVAIEIESWEYVD